MLVNIAMSPAVDPEPLSVAEFKAHSRETRTLTVAEENDLSLKITAARIFIENELGRALITSRWGLYLEGWPSKSYIGLPLGNLQSVESVVYTDSDGVEHTWAATEYKLSRVYTSGQSDVKYGRLNRGYNKSWPTETLDVGEPICITFTCGWATAADVPAPIKAAIELLAGYWYEHREAAIVGENATIESKAIVLGMAQQLAPYQILRVGS